VDPVGLYSYHGTLSRPASLVIVDSIAESTSHPLVEVAGWLLVAPCVQ